jgi:hypothetical protein
LGRALLRSLVLGLEIYNVRPILAAHLTRNNWIMLALIHSAVLLSLMGVYANTPKGTRLGGQTLLATVLVLISWSMNLSLIGKIGGR